VDPAQALADLTEISSQIQAAVLADESGAGRLIEYRPTHDVFTFPKDKRTEDYITGRFG